MVAGLIDFILGIMLFGALSVFVWGSGWLARRHKLLLWPSGLWTLALAIVSACWISYRPALLSATVDTRDGDVVKVHSYEAAFKGKVRRASMEGTRFMVETEKHGTFQATVAAAGDASNVTLALRPPFGAPKPPGLWCHPVLHGWLVFSGDSLMKGLGTLFAFFVVWVSGHEGTVAFLVPSMDD